MTRTLPEPRLKEVDNRTGLTMMQYDKMAPGLLFCDVLVLKARFKFDASGIHPKPLQAPLNLADVHRNPQDPLGSSLLQAGDLILGKPGADLVLQGHLHKAAPSKHWDVEVSVSEQALDKTQEKPLAQLRCSVTGPRHWEKRPLTGWHISEPDATQKVLIAYELGYGGRHQDPDKNPQDWSSHEANPSGSGYSFAGFDGKKTYAAPQWGPPQGLLSAFSEQGLYGLGPIARFWASRKRLAGTYDEAWQKRWNDHQGRAQFVADYADDFDMRYFQCAHPKLQTPKPLIGHEWITLNGVLDWQTRWIYPVELQLPRLGIAASFKRPKSHTVEHLRLPLDTVTIDTDAKHIDLVWRLCIDQNHGIEFVRLELGNL